MNELCPDLEKFKDGWIKGFTNHEVKYGLTMFLVVLGVSGWAYILAGLPIYLAIFMSIWIAVPIGLQGFYQINGMSMCEVIVRYITLSENTYYFISNEDGREGEKHNENADRSKKGYLRHFRKPGKKKDVGFKTASKGGTGYGTD